MAELKVLGEIDERALKVEFGTLQTAEVVVTEERIKHIRGRHPQDVELLPRNYRSRDCAATHPPGQKKCGKGHTHR